MDSRGADTIAIGVAARNGRASGDELPMHFSRRGGPRGSPDATWMWVSAWHIPTEYALGEVDYSVPVTARDGTLTTLKPPFLKGATALRVID